MQDDDELVAAGTFAVSHYTREIVENGGGVGPLWPAITVAVLAIAAIVLFRFINRP